MNQIDDGIRFLETVNTVSDTANDGSCHWIMGDLFGQQKSRIASNHAAFQTSLDVVKRRIGGGGGNRTRVQKYSTASSTYLVLPIGFNPAAADARASTRRVTYF